MAIDNVLNPAFLKNPMELIIFIGIQGAGKSTFYRQHFYDTHLRLNGDMLKTRHREMTLLNACLSSQTKTVIDKMNFNQEARQHYIQLAKAHRFKVIAYYFDTPFEIALHRNNLRIGKAKVPEVGVKSIAKQLTPPTFAEGFDEIYTVKDDQITAHAHEI